MVEWWWMLDAIGEISLMLEKCTALKGIEFKKRRVLSRKRRKL